jgi:hypothetical protein
MQEESRIVNIVPSPIFKSFIYTPRFDEKITDPLYQILFFQHCNAPEKNCYITLGKQTPNGNWYQHSFKPSEIKEGIQEFGGTNVYYSMNNFYIPFRQEKWIKELRALYVDLDFYKIDVLNTFSPEMIRMKVDLEFVDEGLIPPPNGTIFSGNGLQLIWLIEPVLGINKKANRLWSKLQKYLQETLSPVGADPQAIDISRMFRVAGTINFKGEFGKKDVYFVHHHTHQYSMSQLADDFLQELHFSKPVKKEYFVKKKSNHNKTTLNGHSLNKARMDDLETLSRLRNGDFSNMRQLAVWLYRTFALQVTQNPKKALDLALQFNEMFKDPLPKDEVIWHTRSAEKKWLLERENNHRNKLVRGYTLTNQKIIDILNISDEEQKQLKTLVGEKEGKIRHRVSQEKYRRKLGSVPRMEYLQKVKQRRNCVLKAANLYPNASLRELEKITGISKSTIQNILNSCQKECRYSIGRKNP